MDPLDDTQVDDDTLDQDDDSEVFERTDIDADELRDGDVDADGASAIRHRNE
jgi:hypothetical protein